MVTQSQIAQKLGISQMAVSYALNGNSRVGENTRELVLRTAAEMGYQSSANRDARSLSAKRHGRKMKSGLIAVVFPSPHNESTTQMPFYQEVLVGIEAEAEIQGVSVLLCSASRERLPDFLLSLSVDGAVNLVARDWFTPQGLDIPIISLTLSMDSPSMTADSRQGIRLATEHLIELGHTAVGYMGFAPHFADAQSRLDSYRGAMRDAGLDVHDEWIETEVKSFNDAGEGVQRLRERAGELTGLVCYNDSFAMRAVRALEESGYSVPGDMSVTGFDDVSAGQLFRPEITSIWYDRGAMGREAVRWLYKKVEAEAGAEDSAISLEPYPVRLVKRESTASPREQASV